MYRGSRLGWSIEQDAPINDTGQGLAQVSSSAAARDILATRMLEEKRCEINRSIGLLSHLDLYLEQ